VSISQALSSLGVPEGTGASNGTVQTRINLHNETQLKNLLDIGLSPKQQRAQHAGALLDGLTAPAGQPHVPLLHALIRHVVGNDELSTEDRAQLAPAFPITAHVLTQQPAAAPMQVNDVWDVSTPDGTLKVIDLPNGIELQDGGCIVARSTPLHFTCSSFTRTGGLTAGYSGDFNILGTIGAPVPAPPVPPAPPAQAPNGAPGECSSDGIAGDGGQPGASGQPGAAGAAGLPGNNGSASAIATITIARRLTLTGATRQQLIVATQSGPGGGGNGGQGGPGQQGGNGGNGAICGCTGNAGGAAGNGGRGGTGGPAGNGGNSTDAAGNIAVHVPKGSAPAWCSRCRPQPRPASRAIRRRRPPAGRPASLARQAS
jgi:hypothetical protein